jgi:hypothetical protein
MTDTFTTITTFINSPPGQLVAGGALVGIVWKFFERVESLLTENTKLEIAVWLLDRKRLSPTFQNWPDTFAKVFDRVFGTKHLSWKCFLRSCVASTTVFILTICLTSKDPFAFHVSHQVLAVIIMAGGFGCLSDYASLLETRWSLSLMSRSRSVSLWMILVLGDILVSITLGMSTTMLWNWHPTRSHSGSMG